MPLQRFHLVREHVLALMTSEEYAGALPVVPGASLAASDAAQAYLLQRRRAGGVHVSDTGGACSSFGPDAATV